MFAPAHPEYVSGHAAASGAAAEVLTELYGEYSFTTESLGLSGVERSFSSFWEAAQENADSRLWGGVHFGFSNEIGLEQGAEVAQWALEAFNSQTDSSAPTIVLDVSFGYTSELPFAVSGAALDLLSGVSNLSVTIDNPADGEDAESQDVSFDENGSFEVELDAELEDGTYTLEFSAEDGAGNVSNAVTSTIVVDTIDPELSFSNLTDGSLSGPSARLTGTVDGTGAPIVALAYQN